MSYDIIIVNTHRQYGIESNAFREWQGIYLLASYLEEHGYTCRVLSGFVHEILPILMAEIDSGIKVLGFTCDYENQGEVLQLSRHCLARRKLPIIIGGPQAVALGKEFLEQSGALAVVRGEGEIPILFLMQLLIDCTGHLKDIPGILYLHEGRVCENPPPPLIKNLDNLPFSDQELSLLPRKTPNSIFILTARGCPFRCAFCYEGSNSNSVRWRSVENVMHEIEEKLSLNPEIKFVMFTDDTFTLNHHRVLEFCEALAAYRKKRDFCWFAEAHPVTLVKHPEIVSVMVESGLGCLQIGVESGDARVLKAYNKRTTPEMIERAVEICKEAGVPQVVANIIVGGALENRETIKTSQEFGLRLLEKGIGMLSLNAIFFWPLPKTAMTTSPHEYDIKILDPNSLTSVTDYPVVSCNNLSPEVLSEFRYEMEQMFNNKIQELSSNLPVSTIERIFKYWLRYKMPSPYINILLNNSRYFRFCSLLENKAIRRQKDISKKEIGDWHPQRLCRPITRGGAHYADDVSIDSESYRVLVASAGRMTVNEASAYCSMPPEQFLKIAQNLEDIMALGFCRF